MRVFGVALNKRESVDELKGRFIEMKEALCIFYKGIMALSSVTETTAV